MFSNRPDPLTRDLIHLINARRHDHGDADAAIDTLQANPTCPLGLKIDPVPTADLLHKHLHLPAGTVVMVEPRLLTDATLELLSLHALYEHVTALADSQRRQPLAARLHPPVENTAYL